jgi:hypothetical protein
MNKTRGYNIILYENRRANMLKQVKRTSGAIIQRRQGLDHKFQDLIARICIGGRTGMKKAKTQGLFNKNVGTDWYIEA